MKVFNEICEEIEKKFEKKMQNLENDLIIKEILRKLLIFVRFLIELTRLIIYNEC